MLFFSHKYECILAECFRYKIVQVRALLGVRERTGVLLCGLQEADGDVRLGDVQGEGEQ